MPVLSPVANANPLANSSFPAVGLIKGIDRFHGPYHDQVYQYSGMGTLIADRWVLTAAHLVDPSWTTDLQFIVNGNTANPYTADDRFSFVAGDKSWDYNNYDLALIHLSRSVSGVTPLPIYREGMSVGQVLALAGFGDTDNGTHYEQWGTGGVLRGGFVHVDAFPPTDEGDYTLLRTVYGQDANGALSAHGDSGGPLMLYTGGAYYVAGVVSHLNTSVGLYVQGPDGNALARPGSVVDNLRVAPFGSWIDWVINTSTQPAYTRSAVDTGGPQAPGFRDVAPPVIIPPPMMNIRATDATGAYVTFPTPQVSDDYDLNPTVTFSVPSGAHFPIGGTHVGITAIDASGNRSTSGFDVIVSGTPVDIGVYAGGGQGTHWWDIVPVLGHFDTLTASVLDAQGNPVINAPVTFTAPASGPSGTFPNGATSITIPTDVNGRATAAGLTANTVAGYFEVTISTPGVDSTSWNPRFGLTSSPGPVAQIQATAGTPQLVRPATALAAALEATLTDAYGNPTSGSVTFTAPASGPGGTFANGTTSITVATDASGVAAVPFTANGSNGSYTVTASAPGVSGPVAFSLTNTSALGVPATVTAAAGTPQSARVNSAFATALTATVRDAFHNLLSGVIVTFTAPAGGAGGTFANGATSIAVLTDENGVATAPFTANGTGGSYVVSAAVAGVTSPAGFALTNTGAASAPAWRVANEAVGSDGNTRLLWDRSDGAAVVWSINPGTGQVAAGPTYGPYPGWTAVRLAAGTDGRTRLLWNSTSGQSSLWILDAAGGFLSAVNYGPYAGWTVTDVSAVNDGHTRLLWAHSSGTAVVWDVNTATGQVTSSPGYGPYAGWTAAHLAVGADGRTRLLWNSTSGQTSLWVLDAAGVFLNALNYGPYAGWSATELAVDAGGNTRLLWNNTDGTATVWTINTVTGQATGTPNYGPYAGWSARHLAVGADGGIRLLWETTNGKESLWSLDASGNFLGALGYGPY